MKITWWMRGGITLAEAYYLTVEDRELINDIITENLETAKKINQPFW